MAVPGKGEMEFRGALTLRFHPGESALGWSPYLIGWSAWLGEVKNRDYANLALWVLEDTAWFCATAFQPLDMLQLSGEPALGQGHALA